MSIMRDSVRSLRIETFSKNWPLDEEIRAIAATVTAYSHLANPSGQYAYVYLTQFVKALSEQHFGCPFNELTVLDWGCGAGHVSKLLQDSAPKRLEACDVAPNSAQETSLLKQLATDVIRHRFGIQVKLLEHDSVLPYDDSAFDAVLSVGVLEHVPDDRASLAEITRVLKPGGLFFCFFLPTELSWTQQVAHWRGNLYHDRLYTEGLVKELLSSTGLELIDLWYRQLLPKNSVRYPNFRLFEKLDQWATENTLLRYFATNLEFVSAKPRSIS